MSVGSSLLHPNETPCVPHLETAVLTLRHRFEQHVDQEHRLRSCYLGMQQSWQTHCEQMTSQMSMLEGLLATWMQPAPNAPQLSLVSGPEHE